MGNFVSVSCDGSAEPPSPTLSGLRKVLGRRSTERKKREIEEALNSGPGAALCDRPCFHVMPVKGWMNDPNGPVKMNGRYHLFFQHVPNKAVWDFGIVWGHVSSIDLVHWERHPHAVVPSYGSYDADGCFSGCCVEEDGEVYMLYTGVRKRDNPACGPLPPAWQDLGLEFIETQLVAKAVPGDEKLKEWIKLPQPAIPYPPKRLPLVGWRDPFVLPKGPTDDCHTMLMGSGIKDEGGAVMVYKSNCLSSGWEFVGFLATGSGTRETGAMWECPLLAKLPIKSSIKSSRPKFPRNRSVESSLYLSGAAITPPMKSGRQRSQSVDVSDLTTDKSFQIPIAVEHLEEPGSRYFFCISPDAKENPVLYWLGDYRDDKFIIEEAKGPFFLDLGDVVYAPNLMQDDEGNQCLWGWIRDLEIEEAPIRGEQDYSGILSTRRMLFIRNGELFQEPAPEVTKMRANVEWNVNELVIAPGSPVPLMGVSGQAIDMEVTFTKGSSSAMGFVLHALIPGRESATIFYDWETSRLEVVVDPNEIYPNAEGTRKTGGTIRGGDSETLSLRVLIDYSSIELFTHTGQVLTTRVYRGESSPTCCPGIEFVTIGGNGTMTASAYEMACIWANDKSPSETSIISEEVSSATIQSTSSVDHTWWSMWSGIQSNPVIC